MPNHIVSKHRGLWLIVASLLVAISACLLPMTAHAVDPTGEPTNAGTGDPVAPADGTGELLILPTDANAGVEYGVYPIFLGQTKEDGSMFGLEWANEEVSQAVRSAIQAESPEYDPTIAQMSAEFIMESFGETELGVTVVDSSSFAWKLAMAIYNANAPHTNLKASQAGVLASGYYLVMTNPESFDDVDGESGTSPIFAVVSAGKRVQVGEKTDSPSVIKQVMEADTDEWGKRTVAGTNEDVEFMATITLPSNYASFQSYKLEVTDKMENMELWSSSDVHLYIDDNKVTPVIDYNGKDTFKVTIDDLKQLAPDATKDTVIKLKYIAHLVPGASMGAKGNVNTVRLRYTRSPNSDELGSAPISSATVYSWGLKIVKIETGKADVPLAGAEFTVGFVRKETAKDALPDAGDYEGYASSDGSIASKPVTLTTGEDGTIAIPNLPAGTYVISEVKAPEGYTGIDKDFALILVNKWDKDSSAGPYDLEATIVGSDERVTMDAEGSANLGFVSATVGNNKIPPTPAVPIVPPAVQEAVSNTMSDLVRTGRGRAILGSVVGLVALGAFGGYMWLRKKSKDENKD